MSNNDRRFYEGDVLALRDHEYKVETVDITLDERILQYRLEPTGDGPPAHLKPNTDGSFTVVMYYEADPTVIE